MKKETKQDLNISNSLMSSLGYDDVNEEDLTDSSKDELHHIYGNEIAKLFGSSGRLDLDETPQEDEGQALAALMKEKEECKGVVRAPALTIAELCYISKMYVDNYDIYHGAPTGLKDGVIASKTEVTLAKRALLDKIADGLCATGHSKRTSAQIDQRIRDSIKKAKEVIKDCKKGGRKVDLKEIHAPRHIAILIEHAEIQPRLLVKDESQSAPSLFNLKRGERFPMSMISDQPKGKKSKKGMIDLDKEQQVLVNVSVDGQLNGVSPDDQGLFDFLKQFPSTSDYQPSDADAHTDNGELPGLRMPHVFMNKEAEQVNFKMDNHRLERELLVKQLANEEIRHQILMSELNYWNRRTEIMNIKANAGEYLE